MIFNEFDKQMRVYEQSLDQEVLPEMYMVARLDGHGFSKLTKRKEFKKPFDNEFNRIMCRVTEALMTKSNLNIIYGYTQSDEISLLFSASEQSYNRKVRKYNSLLAALASAVASLEFGEPVQFDCRIIPLPNKQLVCDYFKWRQEDAGRNALNGYCYWTARQTDRMSKRAATSMLSGKSNNWKHNYLYQHFIIFAAGESQTFYHVPDWQRRGVGFYFEKVKKLGYNKLTGQTVECERRILQRDFNLQRGKEYDEFILRTIERDEAA